MNTFALGFLCLGGSDTCLLHRVFVLFTARFAPRFVGSSCCCVALREVS